MTVKELITALQTYNPNLLVLVDGYEDGFDDPHINHSPDRKLTKFTNSERWWSGEYQPDPDGTITALILSRTG